MGATQASFAPPSRGRRLGALFITCVVVAIGTLFAGPLTPASAAPTLDDTELCTVEEWRNPSNFATCAAKLTELNSSELLCVEAPTPAAPDSGMAGWFASQSDAYSEQGIKGLYTTYGYAGYDYTTYDIGNCVQTTMHPDYKFENTMANALFLVATSITGASNALREKAWNPSEMWQWADPLVEKATKAVYEKVFTVFGAVTLVVVGLYLTWRARQSDMSNTVTTAGWAVFVMVAVTAIAAWPTWSANAADKILVTSLSVIHDAVGPPSEEISAEQCVFDPADCEDNRDSALRASDTAVNGLLYRNWLRGLLGSADSETAEKYGPVLYDAKSFTWDEIQDIRNDSSLRQAIIDEKADRWERVAKQIKSEDPEAYEYLTGARGMDRIGAGFIAILSALFFALFDLTSSVLILLGFLIFRWAVIAAPILGTFGLFRPASVGLRRLANMVIAAIFNIIIFGAGAAIYLFAVSLIMDTAGLPGWLQVVLILLTGVVGWILLRPYRRITQLGGHGASEGATGWGRLLRDLRGSAPKRHEDEQEDASGRRRKSNQKRPESRDEELIVIGTSSGGSSDSPEQAAPDSTKTSRRPEDSGAPDRSGSARPGTGSPSPRSPQWEEPDVPAEIPSYSVYRPDSTRSRTPAPASQRPESATVSG